MYNEEKLNSIVERFKMGDEEALEVLTNMFLPIIHNQTEIIWHRIEKETDFECRCVLRIKEAIMKFDPTKGKLRSLIINVIQKEKFDFLSRRKRKFSNMVSMDEPDYVDKDGKEVTLDVQDILADVENGIIEKESVNEKVALLAKGDSRRLTILNAWASGEFNDLELSRLLAQSFGGQVETHRKFIRRFRIECQERLATVS